MLAKIAEIENCIMKAHEYYIKLIFVMSISTG